MIKTLIGLPHLRLHPRVQLLAAELTAGLGIARTVSSRTAVSARERVASTEIVCALSFACGQHRAANLERNVRWLQIRELALGHNATELRDVIRVREAFGVPDVEDCRVT